MVAKGGARVQARVCQLHRVDLQLAVADARVFSIHYGRMVFGPVDTMVGVMGQATQI